MHFLTALLFLAPATLAAPLDSAATIESRQSSVTCGSTTYTSSQLSSARNAACNYVQNGGTAGSSTYPHRYNNYEGFDFPVSGPWYEFPILKSGVYTGGSPGADRVVINGNCQRAGEITHTGASGNNFVGCSGTS